MAQPYVGEIIMFGGNFAPLGWAFCEGQIMPISEYETLYELIGTTYGGDGVDTFALPDLRGRIPLHMGNGFVLAEAGGVESVTLTQPQIPSHGHPIFGSSLPTYGANPGSTADPQNAYPAISPGNKLYSTMPKQELMADPNPYSQTGFISPTGGSQPHNNMQPYLCVNFIISLFGIYPSQT